MLVLVFCFFPKILPQYTYDSSDFIMPAPKNEKSEYCGKMFYIASNTVTTYFSYSVLSSYTSALSPVSSVLV